LIRGATIRDVERALGRLRAEESEEAQAPALRTSVMTHMAWVPEPWQDAAMKALGGLAERHPSRTILLFPRPDENRDELDADVDLRCFAGGGTDRGVCFEVVEIRLCGRRAHHPGTVVAPLLITDLPVFLRWRGDPPFGSTELEELTAEADRLVVDSAEWHETAGCLERLAELFDRVAVSDIAWARGEPWRYALAELWPDVAGIETLRVVGPEADALLLAGWLRARLGREVALEVETAPTIEEVAVDGDPVDPGRMDPRSASDLLSDQLEMFGRDRLYEEAVRSFSAVPT
jgi:glucose-6-phosphate dehydrogenase assembly protein OpcA